jgi:hypothetical protein
MRDAANEGLILAQAGRVTVGIHTHGRRINDRALKSAAFWVLQFR